MHCSAYRDSALRKYRYALRSCQAAIFVLPVYLLHTTTTGWNAKKLALRNCTERRPIQIGKIQLLKLMYVRYCSPHLPLHSLSLHFRYHCFQSCLDLPSHFDAFLQKTMNSHAWRFAENKYVCVPSIWLHVTITCLANVRNTVRIIRTVLLQCERRGVWRTSIIRLRLLSLKVSSLVGT